MKDLTPSLLSCLEDLILDYSIIQRIPNLLLDLEFNKHLSSYENDSRLNFFYANPLIIRSFPETQIIVGKADPSRDESIKLLDFLLSNNVKAKLTCISDYNHGFLNLYPIINSLFDKGVNLGSEFINNAFTQHSNILERKLIPFELLNKLNSKAPTNSQPFDFNPKVNLSHLNNTTSFYQELDFNNPNSYTDGELNIGQHSFSIKNNYCSSARYITIESVDNLLS